MIANVITASRILFAIPLLFIPVFSIPFYVFYLICALTDMVDGTVARLMGTASELGSKLDTVADIFFVIICMWRMIPHLVVPGWMLLWIACITMVKIISQIYSLWVKRRLVAEHTIWNKVTGGLLFLLPLTLDIVDLKISGAFVCVIANLAAYQEMFLVMKHEE